MTDYPFTLDLGTRSTGCIQTLCECTLGPWLVRDTDWLVIDSADGIYSAEQDRGMEAYDGKVRLYTPLRMNGGPFRPPNGLYANCAEFGTAARVNTVLGRALSVALPPWRGTEPPSWRWELRRDRLILRSQPSSALWWDTANGVFRAGESTVVPNLPCLPAFLAAVPASAAQDPAKGDPAFWGRVRVMVLTELDDGGFFRERPGFESDR